MSCSELDLHEAIDRYFLTGNSRPEHLRRGKLLRPALSSCGARLMLAIGATVPYPSSVEIGDDVLIGYWSYIGGHVIIGDGVIVGPHCSITGANHVFSKDAMNYRGEQSVEPVVIGAGSWLAAGVVVTPGVRVGRYNLLAAGAVVTADTEDFAIMAGVPAKQVGTQR